MLIEAMCVVWGGYGDGAEVEVSSQVERLFILTVLKIYLLEWSSNMVGGDVEILILFMAFWFRLVNKVEIVIGPSLTKSSEVKVIT